MNTSTTVHKALNIALHDIMHNNDNVVVFGQDVADCGGVFRVTDGLKEAYGKSRVFNTPLSEALIAGMGIGMSMQGLKPIAEFQFMGFAFTAIDQILNHASRLVQRMPYREDIQGCIYRIAYGGQIPAPEHHADSYEQLFATIPGIRVITPSNAQKAYSLLVAASKSKEPVVFLEPIISYHQRGNLDTNITMDLSTCHKITQGDKLSVFCWGGMCTTVEQIIKKEKLQDECELIDLVSLNPIDYATLVASADKTKKCLIIQDSHSMVSVSSDIIANLYESCQQPISIKRLCAPNITQPPFRYRWQYCPSKEEITENIRKLLEK